jgi:hypothetical protein
LPEDLEPLEFLDSILQQQAATKTPSETTNNNKMVLSSQQEDLVIAMACAVVARNNTLLIATHIMEEEEEHQRRQEEPQQSTGDKRGLVGPSTRDKRLKLCHDLAVDAIQRDCLGTPGSSTTMDRTLMGADFKLIFRISRSRFQCLM